MTGTVSGILSDIRIVPMGIMEPRVQTELANQATQTLELQISHCSFHITSIPGDISCLLLLVQILMIQERSLS